jgi:phosphoglycerate kinase
MKFGMNTLDDFEFNNKTVLCRLDLNSPLNEQGNRFKDTTRIQRCLPTLKELSRKGARIVILTHQGGDLEYKNFRSTDLHAEVLGEMLSMPVQFIDDVCGPAAREKIRQLKNGQLLMLDNVRYMAEELTLFETRLKLSFAQQAETLLVRKLSPLADYYVCDAFAAAHRSQPSLVGFPQVIPSAMGRLFEEELTMLHQVTHNPARPCIFILGGSKIQDAFTMMSSGLHEGIADIILTGGVVANIMLLARGLSLGRSSEEFIVNNNLSEFVEQAMCLLKTYPEKIVMPEDLVYVAGDRQEIPVQKLPVDGMLIDIGSRTIKSYKEKIVKGGTIFINGPMGVFEKALSAEGTREIWASVAGSNALSVIGGGDSIRAAHEFDVDGFSYLCTAGGGLVRFLSGEELPVIKALRQACIEFPI